MRSCRLIAPWNVRIEHVDGLQVVVLRSLVHQRPHRLLDGDAAQDGDVVGRHLAADLVLVVRLDEGDVAAALGVHVRQDGVLLALGQIFQEVDGVVGVHVLDDVRGLLDVQLTDVLFRVFQISEDLGHGLRAHQAVQPQALVLRQQRQRVRDVVVVEVLQAFLLLLRRNVAVQDIRQLLRVIRVLRRLLVGVGALRLFRLGLRCFGLICSRFRSDVQPDRFFFFPLFRQDLPILPQVFFILHASVSFPHSGNPAGLPFSGRIRTRIYTLGKPGGSSWAAHKPCAVLSLASTRLTSVSFSLR